MTDVKVITVLNAIVDEVDGEPVFEKKPVRISLLVAISGWMPISKEAVEAN